MGGPLAIVVVIACLAVLGVLFLGLFSMARGGDFNRKYGNALMRWRVVLQGLALVILIIAVLIAKAGGE